MDSIGEHQTLNPKQLTAKYVHDWRDSLDIAGSMIDHLLEKQREVILTKYLDSVSKSYCSKWGCQMTMLAMRTGTASYKDQHLETKMYNYDEEVREPVSITDRTMGI